MNVDIMDFAKKAEPSAYRKEIQYAEQITKKR
jgi:hypothetical protein